MARNDSTDPRLNGPDAPEDDIIELMLATGIDFSFRRLYPPKYDGTFIVMECSMCDEQLRVTKMPLIEINNLAVLHIREHYPYV